MKLIGYLFLVVLTQFLFFMGLKHLGIHGVYGNIFAGVLQIFVFISLFELRERGF